MTKALRLLFLLSAVLAVEGSAQQRFRGDEVVALAAREFQQATQQLAVQRVTELLSHLGVEQNRLQRYPVLRTAKFIKAQKAVELPELSDAVLIARRGAKIVTAKNIVVIADGKVEIAFADAVIIVASGAVSSPSELTPRRGREESGGIYVTRDRIELGHARDPIVYAAKGAKVSSAHAILAYNTDLETGSAAVKTETPGPIFAREPKRKPRSPDAVLAARVPLRFDGDRCPESLDMALLEPRMLPLVRRETNCASIHSATVRCERVTSGARGAATRERWTFQACGRKVEAMSAVGVLSGSLWIVAPEAPPPVTRATEGGETLASASPNRGLINKLSAEARQDILAGEVTEAREKFEQILKLEPQNSAAHIQIAALEAQIAKIDGAVAPLSAKLQSGIGNARNYVDRGAAYLRAGDVGRGLKDYERASRMDTANLEISLEHAQAHLISNRASAAASLAGQLISEHSGLAKAYEIRAWAYLMEDQPGDAYKDAFSSLVEAPPWTPASFRAGRAAYRVLVGYLSLRQRTTREEAVAWIEKWRPMMQKGAWPDAAALHLLGEITEDEALAVAAVLAKRDAGSATAEALAFLVIDKKLAGISADLAPLSSFLNKDYRAGRSLADALYRRMRVGGIKTREEFERRRR